MGRETRFGPVPNPLPLPISTRLPSGVTVTTVGYQPVGMNPVTLLCPRSVMATTATLLLSASATYNSWPSGDNARELGVLPTGAFGVGATLTASIFAPVFRSIATT